MQHLRDRFHPVSCREIVAALDGGLALPRDAALVTFDDGYDDNHAIALPILSDLGVPAPFFVATGHIDSGRPSDYAWLELPVVTRDASGLGMLDPEPDLTVTSAACARPAPLATPRE